MKIEITDTETGETEISETMTAKEFLLIGELLEKTGKILTGFSRKSEKEFDISITGLTEDGFEFSAWLPLAFIRETADWTRMATMFDYPEMVAEGDWSGVRDSSPESVMNAFLALLSVHQFTKG